MATSESVDGFQRFLADIGRIRLLTRMEEAHLGRRVQRGDAAAKQRMVEANLRLVVHVAKGFQREQHGLTLADLVQEGTFGLVRAVEKFDPEKGFRFSTYATIWIRQSIGRAITQKGRLVRLPADVDQRIATLRRAQLALTAELGREPEPSELAARLDWTEDEVGDTQRVARPSLSLHEPLGPDGDGELGQMLADDGAPPHEQVESSLLVGDVQALLDGLAPRERAIIEARFGLGGTAEETHAETAQRLGLRPRDVRRLEDLALRQLRAAAGSRALAG